MVARILFSLPLGVNIKSFQNMRAERIIGVWLLCLCAFGFAGCGNDDDAGEQDPGEVIEMEYDWKLVGDWALERFADSQQENQAWKLSLKADGTGTSDDGGLKWHTADGRLAISFADGTELDAAYATRGSLLSIKDYADYAMELSVVGNWHASEAGKAFAGTDFLYRIYPDGAMNIFSFGSDGFLRCEELQWERSQGGIRLIRQDKAQDWAYQVTDDGTLSVEGNVVKYVHTPLSYEGVWRSVASSEGSIRLEDVSFSMVEIRNAFGKPHFFCRYMSQSDLDDRYYPRSFEAVIYETFFNKQQQSFLLKSDDLDACWLDFRFYLSKEEKKVYLDLSMERTFKEYVRYEYQEQS